MSLAVDENGKSIIDPDDVDSFLESFKRFPEEQAIRNTCASGDVIAAQSIFNSH